MTYKKTLITLAIILLFFAFSKTVFGEEGNIFSQAAEAIKLIEQTIIGADNQAENQPTTEALAVVLPQEAKLEDDLSVRPAINPSAVIVKPSAQAAEAAEAAEVAELRTENSKTFNNRNYNAKRITILM